MTHCIECGNPWGVILNRGEQPSDEAQALAIAELHEVLICERWYGYDEPDCDLIDRSKLPPVRATEVVYLTEALARFVDDNGICDPTFLDDCWQEVQYVDLPAWLIKGRKHRWAYLWDCCNIGGPEQYLRAMEAAR